jgi:hypothetical protein
MFNLVNYIWYSRNQARFNQVQTNLRTAKACIISSTAISGNFTKFTSTSSMTDFLVLKACNVNINPPKAPVIKEVIWIPPIPFWTKCNTDGAALGCPGQASCAGVFRNNLALFLGCFTLNIGQATAFQAELLGVMQAIEIARLKGW